MSNEAATPPAVTLIAAIRTEALHLYSDEWARRLGWTVQDVDRAARELRDDGLLQLNSAPYGVLLCPTLRGAS